MSLLRKAIGCELEEARPGRFSWIMSLVALGLYAGVALLIFKMVQTSSSLDQHIQLFRKKLDAFKTEEVKAIEYLHKIKAEIERDKRREEAVTQNLLSRTEVVFSDFDMLAPIGSSRSKERGVKDEVMAQQKSFGLRLEQESARRRAETIARELWFFIESQLRMLKKMGDSGSEVKFSSQKNERADQGGQGMFIKDADGNTKKTIFRMPYMDLKKENGNTQHERPAQKDSVVSATFDTYPDEDPLDLFTPKPETTTTLEKFRKGLNGYRRALLDAFNSLRKADGADFSRLYMSREMGLLVQRRLYQLQNPSNCADAKKVVCTQKTCGYTCLFHHFVYCLITAYNSESMMLISSNDSPQWEPWIKPFSERCPYKIDDYEREREENPIDKNDGTSHMDDVVYLSIIDDVDDQQQMYLPLAVPADVAERIAVFHGDPPVWWVGQFVDYLLRPSLQCRTHLLALQERLEYDHPIVGVHVRRGDKINTEAAFHPLEEYMVHVEDYYDQLERSIPGLVRRVFLATDEPELLAEAQRKYPNYSFVSDNAVSIVAGQDRDSPEGLKGLLSDVYLLSRSDYLVCTFSSGVCRTAYELMQTLHGDASQNFRSLDDIYYFGGQAGHNMTATESHKADADKESGFIDLEKGDVIAVAGNHWDGFSKGINYRTGLTGLYPSYIVEDHVVTYPWPLPNFKSKPPFHLPPNTGHAFWDDGIYWRVSQRDSTGRD